MRSLLTIKNIGPIKSVDLEINKINLFIGPQSSGKSTIAKLISFCKWLEKDIIIHQSASHIDFEYIKTNLFVYHKIGSYFTEDSSFTYSSDLVKFSYHHNESIPRVEIIGIVRESKVGKINYIPSERNYVAISNIATLNMESNYIRDFIFDWLLIHTKFTKEAPIDILGLVKYYYDKNRGDRVIIGDGKEITLEEASSGLQAAIPLLVFLSYGAEWIFHNQQDLSFEKHDQLQRAIFRYIFKGFDQSQEEETLKNKTIRDNLKSIVDKISVLTNNNEDLSDLGEFSQFIINVSQPHYSTFIIEEPEENLFPITQYNLVKHIFKTLDNGRDNTLVITTHSPYIMSSVNNLIQACNIISKDENAVAYVEDILHYVPKFSYEEVCAYSLKSGYIESISCDEYKLISADSLDMASDVISSDFERLLNYEGN